MMRSNSNFSKLILNNKATNNNQAGNSILPEFEEAADILYNQPLTALPHRRLNPKAVNHKLKVTHLAEARLIQVSDELFKLAEEIRYLNPLMAEVLDEAWESTEEAIEMLSRDDVWSEQPMSPDSWTFGAEA
jgi:flagellar biosynthesis/type III secretory pathway chaperone